MNQKERQDYYDSLGIRGIPCVDHGFKSGPKGYSQKLVDGKLIGRHRLAYCQYSGTSLKDIEGKVVMHLCDNPRCVEPQHLKIGTQKDNIKDSSMKGRKRNWRVLRNPLKYLYEED